MCECINKNASTINSQLIISRRGTWMALIIHDLKNQWREKPNASWRLFGCKMHPSMKWLGSSAFCQYQYVTNSRVLLKGTTTTTLLTHRPCAKWPPFGIRQYQTHFDDWFLLFQMEFHLILFILFPNESNKQYSSIGSVNGLAPTRRQAIIWTNVDPVHRRRDLGRDELKQILTLKQRALPLHS